MATYPTTGQNPWGTALKTYIDAGDAASATAALASAASWAHPVPAVDIFGDSITALNGGGNPVAPPSGSTYASPSDFQARGFFVHALTLLGQRARFGTNYGIGGQTTTQMLARIADPLASTAPLVVVFGGINDIGNGGTALLAKQNLLSIYTQLLGSGKIVIACTVPASMFISGAAITNAGGTAVSATSVTSNAGASAGEILTLGPNTANTENVTVSSVTGAGPYTINFTGTPATKTHAQGDLIRNTTRLAALHDLNQWIIDYTRGRYVNPNTGSTVVGGTQGVHLVDFHTAYADPNTGQPFGTFDATGAVIGVATNPYVTTVDGTHPGQDTAHRMGQAVAQVLDRIVPPTMIRGGDNSDTSNILTNGRCVGDTSGLSTGFTLTAVSGSITATPSKVGRVDGAPGSEAQQVKIGPGNTGNGQLLVGDIQPLVFNGTDAYVCEVEFETDDDMIPQAAPAGGSVPLAAAVTVRNSGGVVAQYFTHFSASGTDGCGSLWPERGVLKTVPFVPTAAVTRLQVIVLFGGVDTGTFRVLSARVRKVF